MPPHVTRASKRARVTVDDSEPEDADFALGEQLPHAPVDHHAHTSNKSNPIAVDCDDEQSQQQQQQHAEPSTEKENESSNAHSDAAMTVDDPDNDFEEQPVTAAKKTVRKRARTPAADSADVKPVKSSRPNARLSKVVVAQAAVAEKVAEDALKIQMLANNKLPLKFSHYCTMFRLHLAPCAAIDAEKAPSRPCRTANPQCLYHCGYGRRGIWQSKPPHLTHLGSSPASMARKSNTPIGLKNLGATCYFNILLQSLFNIKPFRDSLFRYESHNDNVRQRWQSLIENHSHNHSKTAMMLAHSSNELDDLPYHLLSLFLQLEHSHRSFIDPQLLIDVLKLSHVEQQDAHEFRALFVQSLESALKSSRHPAHHSLISSLFEGRASSVLECRECRSKREQSNSFYDLTLLVKGQHSVHQSLTSLLSNEILDGSNAVMCEKCQAKRPTKKYLRLSSLPPFLNIQLMRFDFELVGNQVKKKKIAERIFIPDKIRMSDFTGIDSASHETAVPSDSGMSATEATMEVNGSSGGGHEGDENDVIDIDAIANHSTLASPPAYVAAPFKPVDRGTRGGGSRGHAKAESKSKSSRSKRVETEKAEEEMITSEDQPIDGEADASNNASIASSKPSAARPRGGKRKAPLTEAHDRARKHSAQSAARQLQIDAAVKATAGRTAVYSPASDPSDYHLIGILVHKGQFANHGHYTAMLKDETGTWWNFDDRSVKRIGANLWEKDAEIIDVDSEERRTVDQKKQNESESESAKAELKLETVNEDDEVIEATPEDSSLTATMESLNTDAGDIEQQQPQLSKPKVKSKRSGQANNATVPQRQLIDVDDSEQPLSNPVRSKRRKTTVQIFDPPEPAATTTTTTTTAAARKSKVKKAELDADLSEARRMWGPGGHSKDAYMLIYSNTSHPELEQLRKAEVKLENASDSQHSNGHIDGAHLDQHPRVSSCYVRDYRAGIIHRQNEIFDEEKKEFESIYNQISDAIQQRRREVEAIAPVLQAQPIDLDAVKLLEENKQSYSETEPTRLIPHQWLTAFLSGFRDEEKQKKIDGMLREQVKKLQADETKTTTEPIEVDLEIGASDASNDGKSPLASESPVIALVSDIDGVDLTGEDGIDAAESKSESKKSDTGAADDPGALVIDTDVHVTISGMHEALSKAKTHLDPGSLQEAMVAIRCPHHPSCANPSAVDLMRRITEKAWTQIVEWDRQQRQSAMSDREMNDSSASQTNADFSLGLSDLCVECTRYLYLGDVALAQRVEKDRELLDRWQAWAKQLRTQSGNVERRRGCFYVSKQFINEWKNLVKNKLSLAKQTKATNIEDHRRIDDKYRQLEAQKLPSPTRDIRCPHGHLSPDEKDRVLIDEKLLDGLCLAAGINSAERCDEVLPAGARSEPCAVCFEEKSRAEDDRTAKRREIAREIQSLQTWKRKAAIFPIDSIDPQYLISSSIPPSHGKVVYLMSAAFFEQLEQYHSEERADKPVLDTASLLCQPHGKLLYMPIPETQPSIHGVSGIKTGIITAADENSWKSLRKYGYVTDDHTEIRVEYKRKPDTRSQHGWSCWEPEMIPELCRECALQKLAIEGSAALNYTKTTGGFILVKHIHNESEAVIDDVTAVSTTDANTIAAIDTDGRPSRRTTRNQGQAQLMRLLVSSDDTVATVKMLILAQATSEPPMDRQRLYWHGAVLDNSLTLKQAHIPKGSTIKLYLSDESELVDGENSFSTPTVSEKKHNHRSERGFQGTALARHAHQLTSGQSNRGASSSSQSEPNPVATPAAAPARTPSPTSSAEVPVLSAVEPTVSNTNGSAIGPDGLITDAMAPLLRSTHRQSPMKLSVTELAVMKVTKELATSPLSNSSASPAPRPRSPVFDSESEVDEEQPTTPVAPHTALAPASTPVVIHLDVEDDELQ